MANKTINDFSASTPTDDDSLIFWDTTGSVTYKVTVSDLFSVGVDSSNINGGSPIFTAVTTTSDIVVASGQKVILDGAGGNTYFRYNGGVVELWVDGSKVQEW